MEYEVRITRKAVKEIARIHSADAEKIMAAIALLKSDLTGDIKHLTNYSPEYRLRLGDYRVLFDKEDNVITVRRVLPRKDAYRN